LVRKKSPDPKSQCVVCFSEIPLHRLKRLAAKRSRYGIVFQKDIGIHRGVNPIMYAYKDHGVKAALEEIAKSAKKDVDHPIWRVTPFADAPWKYRYSIYFYELGREWRKVGHFTFQTDEVKFLIIPEEQHKQARTFFDDAKAENTGPSYECHFIDAYWKRSQKKPLLPKYAADSET
jgi:hypothetical protein